MVSPKFLFLDVNEVCNLKCRHCEYWRVRQPSLDVVSLARQVEILEEFAELSPGGKVVICGGEPMLDVNTYFHVCSKAREIGLRTISVVNGTMVVTSADADRVIREGPDEVSVSLDSCVPAKHDEFRGSRGAFERASGALSRLVEARRVMGLQGRRIYAMGLVCASTYRLLDSFYDLVLRQLGADKLKLNVLQPTFLHTRVGQEISGDPFFAEESQVEPEVFRTVLSDCYVKYGLRLNPAWVGQVVEYFRSLYGRGDLVDGWTSTVKTSSQICDSGERNVMVDLCGRVSLCFSTRFPRFRLRGRGDLARFWKSPVAENVREKMRRCRCLCGISHSVRRESATART